MKIVIDIDDDTYKYMKSRCQYQNKGDKGLSKFEEAGVAIKNGVVFPSNPTNGDIIKVLFPNEYFTIIQKIDGWGCEVCMDSEEYIRFSKDWWNAPYGGDADAVSD